MKSRRIADEKHRYEEQVFSRRKLPRSPDGTGLSSHDDCVKLIETERE